MNRSARSLVLVVSLLPAAASLAGCGTVVAPAKPITLQVAGSTAMLPLVADLAAAYEESNPRSRVEFEGGGSRLGMERLEAGDVDIAGCSWLSPSNDGAAVWYSPVPVAWDGIAILAHAKNPVDELTLLQVRSLFAGWTLDWGEVGGGDSVPLIVSREDGSGTRSAFEALAMGEQPVTLTAIVMPSSTAVIQYVSGHVSALGYASMGAVSALNDGAGSTPVKMLRIEGADPTPDTVQDGIYHLTRPLYLVTKAVPSDDVRSFVDYALSPAGQAIIGRHYARVR